MGRGFGGGGMRGPFISRGGPIRGMGPVMGPRGGVFVGRGPVMPRGGFVRGGFVPGGFGHGGFAHGGFVHGGFARNGFVHGGFVVGPQHFFRPYYAFRPHVSLGFGLWAGYPFAYPYSFYSPYYYPDGFVNYEDAIPVPAAPSAVGTTGSIDTQQASQSDLGGLSFEITPDTAELLVDGNLVGTVGEFTPTTQPLGLEAGRHHIEIRASGYQTRSFDVDVMAGQVIPYRGELER